MQGSPGKDPLATPQGDLHLGHQTRPERKKEKKKGGGERLSVKTNYGFTEEELRKRREGGGIYSLLRNT